VRSVVCMVRSIGTSRPVKGLIEQLVAGDAR
jgi:hypothetical protein